MGGGFEPFIFLSLCFYYPYPLLRPRLSRLSCKGTLVLLLLLPVVVLFMCLLGTLFFLIYPTKQIAGIEVMIIFRDIREKSMANETATMSEMHRESERGAECEE